MNLFGSGSYDHDPGVSMKALLDVTESNKGENLVDVLVPDLHQAMVLTQYLHAPTCSDDFDDDDLDEYAGHVIVPNVTPITGFMALAPVCRAPMSGKTVRGVEAPYKEGTITTTNPYIAPYV